MKRFNSTALLVLLVTAHGIWAASSPVVEPPQGYVLLEGAEARLALAGNLFRVAMREVTRKDGSKATVFRDVDYPVRVVDVPPVTGPPTEDSENGSAPPDDEADDDETSSRATEEEPSLVFAAWALLGPEYEDPPPPGSSPSPNRMRRPGPASVVYEFDGYAESDGKDDEYLRLELDFSGTHVIVHSGYWSMEAEAGDTAPSDDAGYDFMCEQGSYGLAFGLIDTKDLHIGVPDVITVTLVRKSVKTSSADEPSEEQWRKGGTGTHQLKRKPADPAI